MNTISHDQLRQVTAEKDPMLARVIEEAIRKINYHESAIASGLQSLQGQIERVQRNLERCMNLNELGEFQSQPHDIDRHIASRQTAWQTLGLILSPEEIAVLRSGYES